MAGNARKKGGRLRSVGQTLPSRSVMVGFVRVASRALVSAAAAILVLAPSGYAIRVEDIPASEVRSDGSLERDLASIRGILERPESAQRLADAGTTSQEVLARV